MRTPPVPDQRKIPHTCLTDSLLHLPLEKLFPAECVGKWLVIDPTQSIVTLLSSSKTSTQPARIWCHQPFVPDALRALLALLRFPDLCPYGYLLAALQVPEALLITMLMQPSDLFPVTFSQLAEHAYHLLQGVTGQRREQHLRHLRRMMTDVMAGTNHLGLTVLSLRAVGYRLQPIIDQERSLSKDNTSRHLDEQRREKNEE